MRQRPGPFPSRRDSTTRAPTRDNDTAGTPHLVYVDLRDLHDQRGVLVLTSSQFNPTHGLTDEPGTRRSLGKGPSDRGNGRGADAVNHGGGESHRDREP